MILKALLNRPASRQPSSKERGGSTYQRRAGVTVNEDTALTYSAVYLSIKIISETLAALPFNVYQSVPGTNNKKVLRNHPLKTLMMQPNDEMVGFTFLSTLIGHSALRGGGFAFIDRDRSNRPGELMLLTPDRVNKARAKATGKIVYEVSNNSAANDYYNEIQMLHLPGMGFDGLTGYSVVGLAARSLATGMAAEEYSASFYENGASPGTVIVVPPEIKLDEDGRNLLIDSFDEKHKGVRHQNKTAIIDQGMTIEQLGIPQKDAQFIESRKFGITDVARWFNMPPHKLKDLERATFSNIEEQNIDFVQDTLMPWIVRLEQTINWKLIGRNNRSQFFKLNVNALMRGDSKARAEYYKTRFNMGSMSINEIKALEDENDIGPIGDKYFMQINMATVDDVVNPPEPPAPPAPPAIPAPGDPAAQPPAAGADPAPKPATNLERFRPLIDDAMGKIVYNITERATAAAKKSDFKTCIVSVVSDRIGYIEKTIEPIVQTIADVDDEQLSQLVAALAGRIVAYFNTPADDLKNHLISDFLTFCATIAENKVTE